LAKRGKTHKNKQKREWFGGIGAEGGGIFLLKRKILNPPKRADFCAK
jgi:hypothetical protein